MQRLDSLQVLRAVAAIAVVFYHTFYALVLSGDGCWLCENESWRKSMIFGVDVFFVISGFIVSAVAERETSAGRFLVKRIWKVVPLYYLMTAIEYWFKSLMGVTPKWDQVWKSLLFFRQPTGPVLIHGWTLVYEMWFYCILTALIALGVRRLGWWGAALMLAMGWYRWPLLLLFAGGCVIGEVAKIWTAPRWLGLVLMLCGVAWWMALSWQGAAYAKDFNWEVAFGNHLWRVERFGLPALLVVASVVLPAWRSALMPTWLVFLGNASYPIYICQQVGLVLGGAYFAWMGGLSYAITVTLICVGLGVTVHLLWERPYGHAWKALYMRPLPRLELRDTPGARS